MQDDEIKKFQKLALRCQLIAMINSIPFSPRMSTEDETTYGCAACGAVGNPISNKQAWTLRQRLDFEHKDDCLIGNLISDLIIATQE